MGDDALINAAAGAFAEAVGDQFIGAPFDELEDVMAADELVAESLEQAAETLGVSYINHGDPLYALIDAVIDRYEETHPIWEDEEQ